MKYHFLILAFNEEELLEKTFKELYKSILEENISDYIISIVDDGSSDKTFVVANNIKTNLHKNLNIIQNKKNIGVANSVKNYINSNDEGKLFLSTCVDCPTIDHVYHFKSISEIEEMISSAGFKIDNRLVLPVEDLPMEEIVKRKITINYCALLSKK